MKFDSSSSFNCPGKEHIKFRIGEDLQIIFCLHKNSNMISGSGYKMEEDMSVNKGVLESEMTSLIHLSNQLW